MSRHAVRLSRVVNSPAERVWTVLTDLERAPEVLSSVTAVEILSQSADGAAPYGVGTRWRETRTMMGNAATEEMWVAAAEAPHRTVVKASSRGADYETVFTLAARGAATRVDVEFSAEMPSASRVKRVLVAVAAPIASRVTKQMLAKDLADIAAAAETQPS
jgi:carbon monoxide dehydrogenase subunit G